MEVCVDNIDSLVAAIKGGASRIELCSSLSEGGLTPSMGFYKIAKKLSKNVPIHILIRPRGGDFLYDENEIEIMAQDCEIFANSGANGLVFGCLDKNAEIDVLACSKIIDRVLKCEKNNGYSVRNLTFHRAFDVAQDAFKAVEIIKELGFSRLLTSGQEKTAQSGIPLLKKLIKNYQTEDFQIMPGGGISDKNLLEILEATGAQEFHASARLKKQSNMEFKNEKCKMGSDSSEYSIQVTSSEKVEKLVSIHRKYQEEKNKNTP